MSTALQTISDGCPAMKEVIANAGVLPRIATCQEARVSGEEHRAFRSLARAIVHQQLAGAAASTIFGRVKAALGAAEDFTRFTPVWPRPPLTRMTPTTQHVHTSSGATAGTSVRPCMSGVVFVCLIINIGI